MSQLNSNTICAAESNYININLTKCFHGKILVLFSCCLFHLCGCIFAFLLLLSKDQQHMPFLQV